MTQLAFIYKCFSLYRLRRLGKPLLSALFVEVALQQAVKASAVAGFVFGHFVNAVVNGVVAEFLGQRGNLHSCRRRQPNSAAARISTFFSVESVTTSPSISAMRAAWSASSKA